MIGIRRSTAASGCSRSLPVINGRRTEVSTDSRDLFVEMTGTDQWTIDKMLNIVCYALSARGPPSRR